MGVRGCCGLDARASAHAVAVAFLSLTAVHLVTVIIAWGKLADDQSVFRRLHGVTPAHLQDLTLVLFLPQLPLTALSLLFNSVLVLAARRRSACAALAWLIYYGIVFALWTLLSAALLVGCGVIASAIPELRRQVDLQFADGRDRPDIGSLEVLFAELHVRYKSAFLCGAFGVAGVLASPVLWYYFAVVVRFRRCSCGSSSTPWSRRRASRTSDSMRVTCRSTWGRDE